MTRTVSFLLLAGLACSGPSEPNPPSPATYRVTPLQLWAGTSITIESQGFRDLGDQAELRFGLTNLPLTRVDDTTMTATVPSTAGGIYDPVVLMGDSLAPLAQLTVWGFAATQQLGLQIPWDVYVWPHRAPQVIGTTLHGALAVVDLATAEVTQKPGFASLQVLRGPGATPDDSTFLFRPPGAVLQSWKLRETPVLMGEHPEIPGTRQVMRLGLHSWLSTTNNSVRVLRRADSTESYTEVAVYPVLEVQGVHLSPRKDRATVRANSVGSGPDPFIPVLEAPSGDLAFYAPIQSSQGVAWSANGSMLAMVGRLNPSNPEEGGRILILDATTGVLLASTTTEREVFAVAFDDHNPYLYVGVTGATGRPAVQVYQRPGLGLLAELDVPASDPDCGIGPSCHGGVLSLDTEHVYVFYGWNGPTRISRFFRPP